MNMRAAPDPALGVAAYDRDALAAWLADRGEPGFRTGQVVRWLYSRGAASYEEMTDLPAPLRTALAEELALTRPVLEAKEVSKVDDTRRYLWRLADDTTAESVGLPAGKRLTVCFSTQAGCAMGCSFCATGAGGLTRDLGPGEMVDQVRLVGEDYATRVTNAVSMGQGEPFANYDATLGGLRLMNDPDGLGIGARHLTVSTCGIIRGIERFTHEPEQFTLAISLHSAVQSTRDSLMPAMRNQRLASLRVVLERYTQHTGRRVSLEYALMDGVNDSEVHLEALIGFCHGLLCHVNLIPVNPVADRGLSRSSTDRLSLFLARLEAAEIQATVRTERGADIEAACGQLTQRHAAAK